MSHEAVVNRLAGLGSARAVTVWAILRGFGRVEPLIRVGISEGGGITVTVAGFGRVEPSIRVGILHSKTGAMAISEESMIDAEVMALKEINEAGGLLGRRVVWVIADGQSDWHFWT